MATKTTKKPAKKAKKATAPKRKVATKKVPTATPIS